MTAITLWLLINFSVDPKMPVTVEQFTTKEACLSHRKVLRETWSKAQGTAIDWAPSLVCVQATVAR